MVRLAPGRDGLSPMVRRAGRTVEADGIHLTWAVADGRRGRRWRWTIVDPHGALLAVHTLETDPGGDFLKVESATSGGLLSLHRESDGSVHGNRVGERGVEHLAFPAPAPSAIAVGAAAIGVAALVARFGALGGRSTVEVLDVADDLDVRPAAATIEPGPGGRWSVRTPFATRLVELDADGLPAGRGPGAAWWPLEEGSAAADR